MTQKRQPVIPLRTRIGNTVNPRVQRVPGHRETGVILDRRGSNIRNVLRLMVKHHRVQPHPSTPLIQRLDPRHTRRQVMLRHILHVGHVHTLVDVFRSRSSAIVRRSCAGEDR